MLLIKVKLIAGVFDAAEKETAIENDAPERQRARRRGPPLSAWRCLSRSAACALLVGDA